MMEAEVGDEQLGEDPSVNRLQAMVAERTGKEAALFLPSGTMCNAIGVKIHTQAGDRIVMDRNAHTFTSEAGGAGLLSGVLTTQVDGKRGVFNADQLDAAIAPTSPSTYLSPPVSLVLLENTHNKGGGKVWPLATFNAVADKAHEMGARTHLDGARLLNAAIASDIPERTWCEKMDTVWIDLSKGLGAPVGAVLAGSQVDMDRARRYKHMLGGAMRQAGIIAAAGIYALQQNVGRMAEDHENARLLANGLAEIPGITIDPLEVETNIVYFDVCSEGISAPLLASRLAEKGVRMSAFSPSRMRAVTHLGVSRSDIEHAVQVMSDVMSTQNPNSEGS